MSEEEGGMLKRHDPAYAVWLTDNPAGFVLLERTFEIHRAACPSVRPTRSPERRPSTPEGGVWCSRGIAPLEYSQVQFAGTVYYCKRCKPKSDPVGVGMHFEYAAKMRAHLAEERALKAIQSPQEVLVDEKTKSSKEDPILVRPKKPIDQMTQEEKVELAREVLGLVKPLERS